MSNTFTNGRIREGSLKLSSFYEPVIQKPMDARQVVDSYADLMKEDTWRNPDGSNNYYQGMIVSVANDPILSYRGIYQLKDSDKITSAAGWEKSSSDSSGGGSITPEQYNAKGDGTTDDTTALQDAMVEALKTGRPLLLTGKYKVKNTIDLSDGFPLQYTNPANPSAEGVKGKAPFNGVNHSLTVMGGCILAEMPSSMPLFICPITHFKDITDIGIRLIMDGTTIDCEKNVSMVFDFLISYSNICNCMITHAGAVFNHLNAGTNIANCVFKGTKNALIDNYKPIPESLSGVPEWNSSNAYNLGDIVKHGGGTSYCPYHYWKAKANIPAGTTDPPSPSNNNWQEEKLDRYLVTDSHISSCWINGSREKDEFPIMIRGQIDNDNTITNCFIDFWQYINESGTTAIYDNCVFNNSYNFFAYLNFGTDTVIDSVINNCTIEVCQERNLHLNKLPWLNDLKDSHCTFNGFIIIQKGKITNLMINNPNEMNYNTGYVGPTSIADDHKAANVIFGFANDINGNKIIKIQYNDANKTVKEINLGQLKTELTPTYPIINLGSNPVMAYANWNVEKTYTKGSIVRYNSKDYAAKSSSTGSAPSSSNTNWGEITIENSANPTDYVVCIPEKNNSGALINKYYFIQLSDLSDSPSNHGDEDNYYTLYMHDGGETSNISMQNNDAKIVLSNTKYFINNSTALSKIRVSPSIKMYDDAICVDDANTIQTVNYQISTNVTSGIDSLFPGCIAICHKLNWNYWSILTSQDPSGVDNYSSSTSYSDTAKVKYLNKVFERTGSGSVSNQPPLQGKKAFLFLDSSTKIELKEWPSS